HPQGPTEPANLDTGCRTDHRIKTLTDTTVETDGNGGLWITLPSGRTYHRPAEPLLHHPTLAPTPKPQTEPPDDPDPPSDDEPPF
ncbi:MAG: HNH endonuclease, partial [Actinomycetes bacterium]